MTEVDGVVDRAVIDATDISVVRREEGYGIESEAPPVDAADRDAVDSAWRAVAANPRALDRLDAWAGRAVHIWQTEVARNTAPHQPFLQELAQAHHRGASVALWTLRSATDPQLRLWATADLLALCSLHDLRRGWGLSSVLSSASPTGDRAWSCGGTIDRPERFVLQSVVDAGELCLWTAKGPDGERWDAMVDPYELPVPVALADRCAALTARHGEICHDGEYDEGSDAVLDRIFGERDALLPELRAALGSAYVVS